MKVKQGIHLPDVKPHYPLFHRLQRSGYRRFVVTNLAGQVEWQIPHLLDDFAGLHAGRRCFVVGNGPSLGQLDMNLLRDEITLGSNRVYLGFERWGFDFTYWGITDWFQIEEYASEYESRVPAAIPQFYPFEYLPYLRLPNGCPLNIYDHYRVPFSDSCRGLALGHSVSFALIQIAVVMGCNPIVLIGMDHRYNLTPRPVWQRAARSVRNALARRFRGTPASKGLRAWRESRQEARGEYEANLALWDTSHSRESTHFDERYAAGNRFLLPEPADAEREYRHALGWAGKHGVAIVNATPDSALEIFPKVSFERLCAP